MMRANLPWYAKNKESKSYLIAALCLALGSLSLAALIGVISVLSLVLWSKIIFLSIATVFLGLSSWFLVKVMGQGIKSLIPPSSKLQNEDPVTLVTRILAGEHFVSEMRMVGTIAPDLALQQFTGQVKAFALEWVYQRNKTSQADIFASQLSGGDELLRRRWNEVVDTLSELEIYLASDPQVILKKLIEKYPIHAMEASTVFREVVDSFDSSWRRKGIHIESAVVSPLKITSSDPILRRLLIGPWRTCAYLARKGNSVVFSAKTSSSGSVVARWEVMGLFIPDDYLVYIMNAELSMNERIEKGIARMNTDGSHPGVLYGLMSLMTWIDFIQKTSHQFNFKHTNDGFVIEVRFQ